MSLFVGTWAVFHPDKEPNKVMASAYWEALKNFTDAEIEIAFKSAIMNLRFFPKPVELIEFIQGSAEDEAYSQAALVLDAIRQHGAYRTVRFTDPFTNAVVSEGFGGWIKLCETPEAEAKWFIKDFCKLYCAYRARNIRNASNLVGLHDQSRITSGYGLQGEVFLIGRHTAETVPVLIEAVH